jgi:hypothetical protein
MHARILHHLFGVASSDVIKAPLWDVTTKGMCCFVLENFSYEAVDLRAPVWTLLCGHLIAASTAAGPTAYPNNAAFVHEFVTNLLTTSFPNMRPQQVQARFLPWCFVNIHVGHVELARCWI